ncbi:hypothetical protein OCH239_07165 [Roseivivax halodurans JCM 10272]|uniref:Uncharacterized protein n=1 Tax=Roseivivax halodurans JCM 10272 TaxID=1449350 RepID=X7EEU3_9RHOB|nr:hypothetical protein OCH239_07165 [Roseivivax halodurans JCM 10272]
MKPDDHRGIGRSGTMGPTRSRRGQLAALLGPHRQALLGIEPKGAFVVLKQPFAPQHGMQMQLAAPAP